MLLNQIYFWKSEKILIKKLYFYFWHRDSRYLFVSDSWYCRIQTKDFADFLFVEALSEYYKYGESATLLQPIYVSSLEGVDSSGSKCI